MNNKENHPYQNWLENPNLSKALDKIIQESRERLKKDIIKIKIIMIEIIIEEIIKMITLILTITSVTIILFLLANS